LYSIGVDYTCVGYKTVTTALIKF